MLRGAGHCDVKQSVPAASTKYIHDLGECTIHYPISVALEVSLRCSILWAQEDMRSPPSD